MSFIENSFIWRALLKCERFLMVLSGAAVVLVIVIKVIFRYVIKTDFAGSEEILIICALWLYYLGGLYGNYRDSHIKADVLSIFVKNKRILRAVNVLVKAISLGVSLFLFKWALDYMKLCIRLGGYTAVYHIPMMFSRAALIFGYTVPVIYNIYHFARSLSGREDDADE